MRWEALELHSGRHNSHSGERLKALWRNSSGAEIAELALVLPQMFMILLGIFWFGRAYNIQASVTRAAQEGARIAASKQCATCAVETISAQDAVIDQSVTAIMQASGLSPSQIGSYAPSPPAVCPGVTVPLSCTVTAHNVRVCRGVQLNPGSATPECGVQVDFLYPYRFGIPSVDSNPPYIRRQQYNLDLKAMVQNKVEYACWQSSGC